LAGAFGRKGTAAFCHVLSSLFAPPTVGRSCRHRLSTCVCRTSDSQCSCGRTSCLVLLASLLARLSPHWLQQLHVLLVQQKQRSTESSCFFCTSSLSELGGGLLLRLQAQNGTPLFFCDATCLQCAFACHSFKQSDVNQFNELDTPPAAETRLESECRRCRFALSKVGCKLSAAFPSLWSNRHKCSCSDWCHGC